jgi:hypothetical protein
VTESKPRWRRSAVVWSTKTHTLADDWTLVSADGELLTRIYDATREDGGEPGGWRWRVYRRDGHSFGGIAESGQDAKTIVKAIIQRRGV